jgi:adenosylhomocysteine nucleosidase
VHYSRIGIIGAMDEEIRLLLDQLQQVTHQRKANTLYHKGTLWGHDVVICKSGVGKVNAAVCAQSMIDTYAVDCVLFTGVAGALATSLHIGDIVVSTDCMYHDMDARALGFALGEIPFEGRSVFQADEQLVQLALTAGKRKYPELQIEVGRVLSGDQFIADKEKVNVLRDQFNGACTEMEGAAVAHVCVMNDIPFVIIRSMSDQADGSAHVNFAEFTVKAAEHSLGIIEGMLQS